MNKIISFILIVFVFHSATAQQRFKAGLKLGLSTSQVEGDTYAGFNKIGLAAGALVTGKFNDKWSAQFEMLYIQKGSKHNSNPDKGDYSFYYIAVNYIEVPVLLQYHQKKFTFELGPGFGYLVSEEEFNEVQILTGLSPFNKTEISLNIGISYVLINNWGFNWRYSNSLSSIRDYASGASTWFNPGQRNNVLTFSLTYQFGNKKTE